MVVVSSLPFSMADFVPCHCFLHKASSQSVFFFLHFFLNSYIHLLPQSSLLSSAVCTLLLCSPDEASLEELKTVCQASVSALHETLACPFVVPGAGCLDTHLASFLRQYGQNSGPEIIAELGCSKGKTTWLI